MKDLLFNKTFTCVAVSKTKSEKSIKKLYDFGYRHFGENKVQELIIKNKD